MDWGGAEKGNKGVEEQEVWNGRKKLYPHLAAYTPHMEFWISQTK